MSTLETIYTNTDFDLKSNGAFDELHAELSAKCLVLHYACGEDGIYTASYESDHDDTAELSGVERDISLMLAAVKSLSEPARIQFDGCHLREFNIGFECGDTWAFAYSLTQQTIDAVSAASCTLAVTLYPMRNPDGSMRA